MNTYRLRRVCIRMVSRVKPSVCSQHCIKHSVASDHPMICRGEKSHVTIVSYAEIYNRVDITMYYSKVFTSQWL